MAAFKNIGNRGLDQRLILLLVSHAGGHSSPVIPPRERADAQTSPYVCAKPLRIRDAAKKGKNADFTRLCRRLPPLRHFARLGRRVAVLQRSVTGRLLRP